MDLVSLSDRQKTIRKTNPVRNGQGSSMFELVDQTDL